MKSNKTFSSKLAIAAQMHAMDRDERPFEDYTNEVTRDQIELTTNEREEFELETGAELIADELSPVYFDLLLNWLRANDSLENQTQE